MMDYVQGSAAPAAQAEAPQLPLTIHVFDRKGEPAFWRAGTFMLDSILVHVLLLPLTIATFRSFAWVESFFGLWVLAGIAVSFLYPLIAESLTGTTLGKRWGSFPAQLRVIRLDGGRIGFKEAAIRAGLGLIETNLFLGPFGVLIGMLAATFTKDKQRLGDMLAGTLVVDSNKLVDLTVTETGATLVMADDRVVELAALDSAVAVTWLGKTQSLNVAGRTPAGERAGVRMRYLAGATVFSESQGMDAAKAWLEWRFGTSFENRLQWWRLLFLVLPFLFVFSNGIFELLFLR